MTGAMLFGKLPAHGDFVARGIAAAERDELDAWLAGSLADAREAIGNRYDETYDEAQPWRFAWAEGEAWTAGALAPSVDAAGRRYPILLALRGVGRETIASAAAAAEEKIYEAFAGGWTANDLAAAMAAVEPSSGEWTSPPGWWTVDADGAVAARVDGARPPDLIRAVLTMGVQEGGA